MMEAAMDPVEVYSDVRGIVLGEREGLDMD